jgi:hypothetical protein
MNPAQQVPWLPGQLRARNLTVNDAARLSYIVVDEIVDDVVTLAVHPWPVADRQGRVRFPDLDACRHATVSLRSLKAQLYHGWLQRDPRVGDVFGAGLTDPAKRALARRDNARYQLRSLVTPPVYDLSQDARVAAKLAYYAAMAPVLTEKEIDRWNLAQKAEPAASVAGVRPYLGAPGASVRDA